MSLRLPRRLHGKIIYATPGSGKTHAARKFDDVIDTDDLIVEAAEEVSSGFNKDDEVDDNRLNIFRYMRYVNFSRRYINRVYDRTKEMMREHAEDGMVVLLGTVDLMEIADLILLQQNGGIVRQGFDQAKECTAIDRFNIEQDTVFHFNSYLEPALVHDRYYSSY